MPPNNTLYLFVLMIIQNLFGLSSQPIISFLNYIYAWLVNIVVRYFSCWIRWAHYVIIPMFTCNTAGGSSPQGTFLNFGPRPPPLSTCWWWSPGKLLLNEQHICCLAGGVRTPLPCTWSASGPFWSPWVFEKSLSRPKNNEDFRWKRPWPLAALGFSSRVRPAFSRHLN